MTKPRYRPSEWTHLSKGVYTWRDYTATNIGGGYWLLTHKHEAIQPERTHFGMRRAKEAAAKHFQQQQDERAS